MLGVGPESDDLAFFSVMYPHVPPELLPEALDAHTRVSDLLTPAGGKRYGPDWMGRVDHEGWRWPCASLRHRTPTPASAACDNPLAAPATRTQ